MGGVGGSVSAGVGGVGGSVCRSEWVGWGGSVCVE